MIRKEQGLKRQLFLLEGQTVSSRFLGLHKDRFSLNSPQFFPQPSLCPREDEIISTMGKNRKDTLLGLAQLLLLPLGEKLLSSYFFIALTLPVLWSAFLKILQVPLPSVLESTGSPELSRRGTPSIEQDFHGLVPSPS